MKNENDTWFDDFIHPIYQHEPRWAKFLRLLFGVWAYAAVAILMLPLIYLGGLFTIDAFGAASVAVYLFLLWATIFRARRDLQTIKEEGGGNEHP